MALIDYRDIGYGRERQLQRHFRKMSGVDYYRDETSHCGKSDESLRYQRINKHTKHGCTTKENNIRHINSRTSISWERSKKNKLLHFFDNIDLKIC